MQSDGIWPFVMFARRFVSLAPEGRGRGEGAPAFQSNRRNPLTRPHSLREAVDLSPPGRGKESQMRPAFARATTLGLLVAFSLAAIPPAAAEVAEIRMSKQYGL